MAPLNEANCFGFGKWFSFVYLLFMLLDNVFLCDKLKLSE
jgi:hypothetical protein